MKASLFTLVMCACGSAAFALPQVAAEVAFSQGQVTISASDAPIADVLKAWAEAGHTELAGAEYLGTRRITLRLSNAPEETALTAIVGSPAWFRAARRDYFGASESMFRRIDILPAAAGAINPTAATPEQRYEYAPTPLPADLAGMAMNQRPVSQPPAMPAHYPEVVYDYAQPKASPDALKILPAPGDVTQQPAYQMSTESPVPERTYQYAAPLESSEVLQWTRRREPLLVLPDLEVINGFGDGPMPGEPIVR